MSDERAMIDSEETMAGAARQSRRRSCTCYFCKQGRCLATGKPLPDDDELRRQLAKAKERADELQRQNDLYVEARGEIVDLQLHNAQLRTALEGLRNRMKEEGLHHLLGLVNRILSSSPENPYAAVVEAGGGVRPMTFRAAYWTDHKGAEVLLTSPEHADLSDQDLLDEARREADRQGLDLSYGEIVVGEWTE